MTCRFRGLSGFLTWVSEPSFRKQTSCKIILYGPSL